MLMVPEPAVPKFMEVEPEPNYGQGGFSSAPEPLVLVYFEHA